MNHAAFFNGEGGFQLAAEWMGWENVISSEIDPYCNYLTKQHYPNCIQHHDIRTTDFRIYRGFIDIVTGGFPCQPFSVAGEQQGTDDVRYLWPEMFRAIREIAPRWAVCENVYGLVSWNGGMVFDKVQSDLESIGYEVAPFIVPAAGVNAPHKRDRVWFVAFNSDGGSERFDKPTNSNREMVRNMLDKSGRIEGANRVEPSGSHAPDTKRRDEQRNRDAGSIEERVSARPDCGNGWQNFPTQPPVCSGNDGLPTGLVRQFIRDDCNGILSEKEIDAIISKAVSKWRKEVIKMGGNAVVSQVVYQIFKTIELYEQHYINA